jgi:hypothetical protein
MRTLPDFRTLVPALVALAACLSPSSAKAQQWHQITVAPVSTGATCSKTIAGTETVIVPTAISAIYYVMSGGGGGGGGSLGLSPSYFLAQN